jgi:CheY-like chemotaxis protein
VKRFDSRSDILLSCGSSGVLVTKVDWKNSSLGSIEQWPQSLFSAVVVGLKSRLPTCIFWGPESILFYNDSYIPMIDNNHPALGLKASIIQSDIGPILIQANRLVISGEMSTLIEDRALSCCRSGVIEECYVTISSSAIIDEKNNIGGVIHTVIDTTKKIVDTRRINLLSDLSRATELTTKDEAIKLAIEVISKNPADVTFAVLYNHVEDASLLTLETYTTGIDLSNNSCPSFIDLKAERREYFWPIQEAMKTGFAIVNNLPQFVNIFGGKWPEPTIQAAVINIPKNNNSRSRGILIVGLSPRRPFDTDYKTFLMLVAKQISQSFVTTEIYEIQSKRNAELEEMDKAKTIFFTNVSHEFRTPLTLMLGPLADSINDTNDPLSPQQRGRLLMIQRNSIRLLKLVNSLLDFSRIQAGRAQAQFVPVNITKLTREISSSFEPLLEDAGLRFILKIEDIAESIYLDKDMWEKIILNLLSNAFKFTKMGAITLSLKQIEDKVQLSVEDTGTGMPSHELPRLFERFHRIENSEGRSIEGSGIGLSMVQELVNIHVGTIHVESSLGIGSKFTITIPLGKSHLPQDKIKEIEYISERKSDNDNFSSGLNPIIMEARRWNPKKADHNNNQSKSPSINRSINTSKKRILVVDDNPDMRSYIGGILSKYWDVESTVDGEEAFDSALNNPPSLILSDIMMPNLDGFGLMHKLRAHPNTKSVPIILLSARAGDNSVIEGLDMGADDYLVKTTFSEKELVARVNNHIELGKLRHELEKEVEKATTELREANNKLHDFIDMICHELRNPLQGISGSMEMVKDAFVSIQSLWKSTIANNNIEEDSKLNLLMIAHLDKVKGYYLNIEDCVIHQKTILDQVIFLTMLDAKKISLVPAAVEPVELLSDLIKIFEEQIANKSLQVNFKPAEGIKISIDIKYMKHILESLFGVLVTSSDPNSIITVQQFVVSQEDQNLVALQNDLSSTSQIQSENDLGKQQSQINQYSNSHGTGQLYNPSRNFVLAIINRLIVLLGGSSDEFSIRDNGFSFTVLAKRMEALTDADITNVVENLTLLASNRKPTHMVLIAEDNVINQTLCRAILKKKGYQSITANNGVEAVDKFVPGKFDFILMDIAMPEMNGIEATKLIRNKEQEEGIEDPVVIIGLSAYAQHDMITKASDAGMNDYISKPASFQKIGDIIGQWTKASLKTKSKSKEDLFNQNLQSSVFATKNDTSLSNRLFKPVLIAEDNNEDQLMISGILQRLGYETTIANDGEEALSLYSPDKFAFLIISLQLPIMNGMEVTRKLRELEDKSNLTTTKLFILGLSSSTNDNLEEAINAGVNECIKKPITSNNLQIMIERNVKQS